MSFHGMVHSTTATGDLTTTWCPKVETLEAAEPLVRRAISEAKRAGRTGIRIDIFDDLTCVSAFRARVKS